MTQKTTVDVTDANQPKVDQTNREHPDSAQATGNVEDGVEGGVEGGVVGGVVGTSAPIDYRLVEANTTPDTAVLFRTEMNAPKQVSGPSLVEGIQVSESGSWYGRCTIKTDGSVTHCKVLRSLPAIDKQLVKNLEAQKYTPVIYRGRPQTVFYTFKVVFK